MLWVGLRFWHVIHINCGAWASKQLILVSEVLFLVIAHGKVLSRSFPCKFCREKLAIDRKDFLQSGRAFYSCIFILRFF
jgi:hypothetical protein